MSKRMHKVVQMFFGSIAVYLAVVMAHGCGSGVQPPTGSAATQGAGGFGGSASTSSGKGGAGGIMNPVDEALAESGSRLRAQWVVGEDGSKSFDSWYDSQRKEQCLFSRALDTTLRCLPAASPTYYYSNSVCTLPLAMFPPNGCYSTPYASVTNASASCMMATHYYPVGDVFTGATVYTSLAGACQQTVSPAGYTLYETGAEVLASAFVAGSLVVD